MNPRAIRADFLYTIRTWYRTPARLIVSIVFPVCLFLLLGYVFGASGGARTALYVEDRDGSPESHALVSTLSGLRAVDVRPTTVPAGASVPAWMAEQRAAGLLRIPGGFGATVAAGGTSDVELRLATPDPVQADTIRSAVRAALADYNAAARPTPGPAALVVRAEDVAPPLPYTSFLLPGIIGMNIMGIGLFTSYGFGYQLRGKGLMDRLALAPMSKADWLLGRMLGLTAVSVLSSVLLSALAIVLFRTRVDFGLWPVAIIFAGTLVSAGIGTTFAGVVKSQELGAFLIQLLYLPMVIVSGSFFKTNALPQGLRWVADVLPLSYINNGLRAAMVLGDDGEAMKGALVLLLGAVAIVLVGARVMDWRAER